MRKFPAKSCEGQGGGKGRGGIVPPDPDRFNEFTLDRYLSSGLAFVAAHSAAGVDQVAVMRDWLGVAG